MRAIQSEIANVSGSNQSEMRDRNERLVMTLVRRHEALSKSEIAKLTGLTAQTVSVIMRQLEADGLLLKREPIRGKIGQPSVPMALNPDGAYFFGLKIGRRSAEFMLIDLLGTIRHHARLPYAYPTIDSILSFVQEAINNSMSGRDKIPHERIHGMGIAMPFEIWSWAEFIGLDPSLMAHWQERDIVEELSQHFDFPIYVQNDASAACGAELAFGSLEYSSNFLYIYIGYFAGGGVVLNDRLYTGVFGNAGAVGSLPVTDENGQQIQLLETSSIATLEKIVERKNLDASSILKQPEDWDIPDAEVAAWLQKNAHGLAQAIQIALSVIDFEMVVIDGWMPATVRHQLVRETAGRFAKLDQSGIICPRICEGTIGVHARPLGAASLPLAQRYMLE